MGEPREPYDQVIVTRHANTVEQAPYRALMSVSLLREACTVTGTDTLYVGHTAAGVSVFYRIVGWDAAEKALIIERMRP